MSYLLAKLPYLSLKTNNGPIYLMGWPRSISLIDHGR